MAKEVKQPKLSKTRTEVKSAEAHLNAVRNTLESHTREIQSQMNEVNRIINTIEPEKQQLKTLEGELQQLQDQKLEYTKTMGDLSSKVVELSDKSMQMPEGDDKAAIEQQIQDTLKQSEELEGKINTCDKEIGKIEIKIKEQNDKIAPLQGKLDSANETLDKLVSNQKGIEKELTTAQENLGKAKKVDHHAEKYSQEAYERFEKNSANRKGEIDKLRGKRNEANDPNPWMDLFNKMTLMRFADELRLGLLEVSDIIAELHTRPQFEAAAKMRADWDKAQEEKELGMNDTASKDEKVEQRIEEKADQQIKVEAAPKGEEIKSPVQMSALNEPKAPEASVDKIKQVGQEVTSEKKEEIKLKEEVKLDTDSPMNVSPGS